MQPSGVIEYWDYESFGDGNLTTTVCANPSLKTDWIEVRRNLVNYAD